MNRNVTITMSQDLFEFLEKMAERYTQGNKSRLIRVLLRYYEKEAPIY